MNLNFAFVAYFFNDLLELKEKDDFSLIRRLSLNLCLVKIIKNKSAGEIELKKK